MSHLHNRAHPQVSFRDQYPSLSLSPSPVPAHRLRRPTEEAPSWPAFRPPCPGNTRESSPRLARVRSWREDRGGARLPGGGEGSCAVYEASGLQDCGPRRKGRHATYLRADVVGKPLDEGKLAVGVRTTPVYPRSMQSERLTFVRRNDARANVARRCPGCLWLLTPVEIPFSVAVAPSRLGEEASRLIATYSIPSRRFSC